MNKWDKQRGMSLWGVLGGVAAALIVFWIGIKVVPEYMQYNTVQTCLEDAKAGGGNNIANVQKRFYACLNANSIAEVDPKNIVMHGSSLSLKWEKQLPITGNASLLLEFEAQAPKP